MHNGGCINPPRGQCHPIIPVHCAKYGPIASTHSKRDAATLSRRGMIIHRGRVSGRFNLTISNPDLEFGIRYPEHHVDVLTLRKDDSGKCKTSGKVEIGSRCLEPMAA